MPRDLICRLREENPFDIFSPVHVTEQLRHLFAHVDRTTTGPRSLTGEIRKSLAGCEKLSVVSSTPIEYTLCEVTNKKDLSTDQLYLMEICKVIHC
ncbi:hypothetical protein AVEN_115037-1 [Araneus ventricosus]|uniref:Uncharacterized protein n=1 Tax=Araneus ventricosus TaxID=182803 RepID=A0A4Y1ZWX9_ARAVE|nr:hypothetical protein AVEN_115037-1 [Araneus ventricosus]